MHCIEECMQVKTRAASNLNDDVTGRLVQFGEEQRGKPFVADRDMRDSLVVMGCRFGSVHMDIMADFSDQICHAVSLCCMMGKTLFWA